MIVFSVIIWETALIWEIMITIDQIIVTEDETKIIKSQLWAWGEKGLIRA